MDPASDDEKHQQQHQQQREDEGGELRGAAVAPDPTSNGPTPSSSSTSESSQTEQEQNASQQELSSSPTAPPNAADENMDVARRFLADDNVRNATRAQKVRFLRSKGLRDEHIEKLLSESERRVCLFSNNHTFSVQQACHVTALFFFPLFCFHLLITAIITIVKGIITRPQAR